MDFKEKMMDNMMKKMSAGEKTNLMDKMMEGFFSSMTKEEKKDMMDNMMPKMMGQMMGGDDKSSAGENPMMNMMGSMMGGKGSMMDMMQSMMGNSGGDKESNPMDMCKQMMYKINQSSEIATFATPEIRQLFEEWVQQVDEEILDLIQKDSLVSVDSIAKHLKISKNSVIYFLSRLAQKGKISLNIDKNAVGIKNPES